MIQAAWRHSAAAFRKKEKSTLLRVVREKLMINLSFPLA